MPYSGMTKKTRAARNRMLYERKLRKQGKTVAQDMAEWAIKVKYGIHAAKKCPHNHDFSI